MMSKWVLPHAGASVSVLKFIPKIYRLFFVPFWSSGSRMCLRNPICGSIRRLGQSFVRKPDTFPRHRMLQPAPDHVTGGPTKMPTTSALRLSIRYLTHSLDDLWSPMILYEPP
ncbi:hypothetical protein EVAR_18028_1 [Eumeta japonica]|uniref:Uncharacterized protein n=1 Tax=Eumeta variegata TaxID=151549 RepID=A0A4C1XX98_EUMVA|nr:hypothetical protein EVAR_18028_1 [Eumeta japonica]